MKLDIPYSFLNASSLKGSLAINCNSFSLRDVTSSYHPLIRIFPSLALYK